MLIGSDKSDAFKLWDATSRQEIATLEVDGVMVWNIKLVEDDLTITAKSFINNKAVLHDRCAPTWEEIAANEAEKKTELCVT